MGKPTKQHRKKKFNYDRNRKKQWLKSKKMPSIQCKQIKHAWDEKKSVQENMKDMGLSVDPNKTLKIPKTKDSLVTSIPGTSKKKLLAEESTDTLEPIKKHVAMELEAEANLPQQRRVRMSEPDVRYCIYMMEKYGEDYKAMARDFKNYYQDTPKQIKSKIKTFKSIPEQYGKYLKEKADRCNSGVTTPSRRTIDMGVVPRHDTRTHRAKRRNGHFTTPPGPRVPSPVRKKLVKSEELPLHRVKRRLHFGRIPPKPRLDTAQPAKHKKSRKPKGSNSSRKSGSDSKNRRRRLSRELNHLLNMTAACVIPVRLRSTLKSWGHCHGDQNKQCSMGYKLHSSHELTNLKITGRSRQN